MSGVEARLILHVLGDMMMATPSDEEIEAGAEPGIELHLPVGIPVPVGPSQAIGAPLGMLTVKLNKTEAKEFFEQGVDTVNNLPDPKPKSDIMIASNVNEVAQQAEKLKKFTT